MAEVTTVVEDLTTRVSGTTSYNSAVVIDAKKGPIGVPVLVTGQTDFLRKFTPNERIEIGWDPAYYEADKYLDEINSLYVVRAGHNFDGGQDDYPAKYGGCVIKSSTSDNSNIPLEAGLISPDDYIPQEDDVLLIYGIDQGNYNNSLSVMIITDQSQVKLDNAFIIKVYKDQILVETFTVSLIPNLKNGYGVSCFVETVLQQSMYIRCKCYAYWDETIGRYPDPKVSEGLLLLNGGDDGITTDADRVDAINKLSNINDIDIKLIWDGGYTTTNYQQSIVSVCDKRDKQTIGILSTPYEYETLFFNKTEAIGSYRKDTLNINNCSAELYTPHQKYYDRFNDRYVYISPGPYVAAAIMKTARNFGWYYAAAGYNRGVINSLDPVVTFEPEEVKINSSNQVNTIIKDPGFGNVIMDELTLLGLASDLQEAHISRYIHLYLRPALKDMLKAFLFEFNDEETRSLVSKKIDTFMRGTGRAFYSYRIVCDESNNLDTDIENNRLVCWLYVKPTKLAKDILQKITLTPYSVDLESLQI